ncbi:MAG TPA: Gfo/Idh/MocA family oxidoreductase [Candidatus Hydrogenedentes bacterium]|nr:Gfo/Idh/MocA family oxidoreductase [Candidatus Hydrogenedentota bacterium]HPG66097.1 Gfo/Idh/MocA family oxidoreductase [Candidatus Hydrogenedentota bacterium]
MDKIGFGLIGTGLWGRLHSRVYGSAGRAQLLGVADLVEARAQEVASEYDARAYTDYRQLLEDDRIRAVSIVTPDFAHTEIALAAVEAGKHILCEKPLATTVEEAQRIVDAAAERGIKLMVDFHARWSPPLYNARQAVKEGAIGDPQHVYYRLSDRIGVPTEMLSWAGRSTVMWFIGSHSIDTLRWLLDDEVVRVYAVSSSRVLKAMGIDTPDYYQATLTFRSGVTAVLENSWIMPNTMPNIIDLKCELVGSKGALYFDGSHHRALEKYTVKDATYPDVFVMPTIYGEQKGFAAESIRHFIDCVIDDREPLVTGRDGLEVTRVIAAIEESIRTKQPVEVR